MIRCYNGSSIITSHASNCPPENPFPAVESEILQGIATVVRRQAISYRIRDTDPLSMTDNNRIVEIWCLGETQTAQCLTPIFFFSETMGSSWTVNLDPSPDVGSALELQVILS